MNEENIQNVYDYEYVEERLKEIRRKRTKYNRNSLIELIKLKNGNFYKYWTNISKNQCITIDYIESHKDYYWNYNYLADNPNITWKFIL